MEQDLFTYIRFHPFSLLDLYSLEMRLDLLEDDLRVPFGINLNDQVLPPGMQKVQC